MDDFEKRLKKVERRTYLQWYDALVVMVILAGAFVAPSFPNHAESILAVAVITAFAIAVIPRLR